jgi:hypothetical protein
MKTYRGGGIAPHILDLGTIYGCELSDSRSGRFTPGLKAPHTHWIGDLVGSRDGLDSVAKRRIPSPRRESNPPPPALKGKGTERRNGIEGKRKSGSREISEK